MGKSVAKGLKYKGEVLLEEFPDRFNDKFENNKTKLNEIKDLPLSKSTRNILAGYIVRLAKRKKAAELK
ncbi:MAG: 30S ribosomal protein S17e [archaeon]|jgi:ribosomal protein S17E